MRTSKELRKFQRQLKRRPSPTELVFKRRLELAGVQFKFQPIVGFYIPDFVFPDRMLIIELDGPSHEKTQSYDKSREGFLKLCGFDILRIKNGDMRHFDIGIIAKYPIRDFAEFRSALARANSYRGHAMRKQKKRRRGKARTTQPKRPAGILDRLFHHRYMIGLA